MGHLLTRSDLTYPEVSSKVCHNSFCQLGNSVSLSWVIYYEAFYLHVVSSFSCKMHGTIVKKKNPPCMFEHNTALWHHNRKLGTIDCITSLRVNFYYWRYWTSVYIHFTVNSTVLYQGQSIQWFFNHEFCTFNLNLTLTYTIFIYNYKRMTQQIVPQLLTIITQAVE